MKVFDRIEVSFHPIGYANEDIDQVFSGTYERLRSQNAITLEDLHEELRAVYNVFTTVTHMYRISN